MTHTQGPWTVNEELGWIEAQCGLCFARIAMVDDSAGCEPGNAQLIAAAPEMLEAIEDTIGAIERDAHDGWFSRVSSQVSRLQEVAKKARGEE